MSESGIPPHKHCPVCGMSMPPDQDFCSKKCEEKWEQMLRQRKKIMYVTRAMVAVTVAIIIIAMLMR